MTEQKMGFDFEALRRGVEGRDADVLIGLYADDAELRIVNKRTPQLAARAARQGGDLRVPARRLRP
jgi:hypothetical protein